MRTRIQGILAITLLIAGAALIAANPAAAAPGDVTICHAKTGAFDYVETDRRQRR